MTNDTDARLGICPGCEENMPPDAAVSQFDDVTPICLACARVEATTLAAGGRLTAPGFGASEIRESRIEPVARADDAWAETFTEDLMRHPHDDWSEVPVYRGERREG